MSTSASLRALTSRPTNPLRRELRPGLQGARWITPVAPVMPWQLVGTTGLLPESWPESPLRMLRSAFDLLCIGQLSQAVGSSVRRTAAGFADGAVAVLVAGSAVGSMPLYVDVVGRPRGIERDLFSRRDRLRRRLRRAVAVQRAAGAALGPDGPMNADALRAVNGDRED